LKSLLVEIGLEPERIEMFNMSAAMGNEFVNKAIEMTETIKRIGPNPIG
jgi:F420-non-reducing hydrogenase iron-sulfur subunit